MRQTVTTGIFKIQSFQIIIDNFDWRETPDRYYELDKSRRFALGCTSS
jgi:hypothetical protein